MRVTFEDHPELVGYVPTEGMPHRRRMRRIMRIVVIVAVAALILPTVLGTWSVANRSAASTCAALVQASGTGATGSSVAFDLFGDSGPQWYCSADFGGRTTVLGGIGVIPYGR